MTAILRFKGHKIRPRCEKCRKRIKFKRFHQMHTDKRFLICKCKICKKYNLIPKRLIA